jgi:membrane associated rhomboid family serine protease
VCSAPWSFSEEPPLKLLFALVCVVSLWVLFSPGSDTPSIAVSDKLVHGTLFAALALTGALAGVPVLALAPGLVVYAGVSEVLQAVLPIDRDGDWHDALADVIGVLIGLLLAMAWRRRQVKNRAA